MRGKPETCDTSVQHCGRSHAATPASILLRGYISPSTCDPSCECACHEIVTYGTALSVHPDDSPLTRRQHPAWRLVTCVYSDR